MGTIGKIIRFATELLIAILGPVLLVVAGGLLAGLGVYLEWRWMIYGGVIVAAMGVLLLVRLWE